jgi:putative DNA primase/helicase
MVESAVWHVEHRGCAVFPLWGTDAGGVCRCPKRAACDRRGKHPYGPLAPAGVKDASRDPVEIRRILAGRTAYGMTPPEGMLLFDLDGSAISTWERLAVEYGLAPDSWGQTTKNGRHEGYAWPVGGPADPGGNLAGIVTRRGGSGYVVGPFSEIAGHVYEPDLGPDGLPLPFAPLPSAWAEAFVNKKTEQAKAASSSAKTRSHCRACGPLEEHYGENERYGAILSLTMRLHTVGHAHEVQWEHVRDHLAPRFDPPKTTAEVRGDFERATADPARMDQKAATWQSEHSATPGPPAHLVRQSLAAWYFAQMAGDRVRFDHGRKRWLIWLEHRWQPDEDGSVQRLWLEVLATRYAQALQQADDKERARLAAEVQVAGALNSAITAGLAIASSMEPLATTADAWDRDPWVLGCENGIVDLRTGLLRPGRPEEMISRSTGIAFDPNASCSRWRRFLVEVFAGDEELADWYGLLIGTSLIGVPLEVLAMHHGLGNNGKSVAVGALRKATGDYAVVIPVETLANAKRAAGDATPDLMALRGARIAFTSEPDLAAKLRGGVLKRLASVDRMTGRPLYGGTLTWEPTHTVHLATNHLPAVDDATEGFWRRVALVPWNVHFRKPGEDGDAPPEDPDLAATLATESAGILAWAVRWAVAFAAGRKLHPFPSAVRVRTDAYRADEDKLGAFVAERVVYERNASVNVGVLFAAYRDWCESESIVPFDRMGQKAFSRGFEERGHAVGRGRDAKNRVLFTGARLGPGTNPEHPEHSTTVAGTPHAKDASEEVRQGPPDAPDAPEPVVTNDPRPPELKLAIDWPTP